MTYQRQLYAVAYRMLGSVSDAEDIVQDVFLASQNLDFAHVQNVQAYLVKSTANRCLNMLKSERKRREVYTGPWLPEPEVTLAEQEPVEAIIQSETLSYAFLVLLEQLTPVERVIFVLRESLEYDYQEIADVIGKSEVNCRKIYSRCKRKLQQKEVSADPFHAEQAENLVRTFMHAAATGTFGHFIQLLKDEAVLVTDGGGKVRAAVFPIFGRERIQAFFEGIVEKGAFSGELLPVLINGEYGILHRTNGTVKNAICFGWDGHHERITHIYMMLNPDKLKHIVTDPNAVLSYSCNDKKALSGGNDHGNKISHE